MEFSEFLKVLSLVRGRSFLQRIEEDLITFVEAEKGVRKDSPGYGGRGEWRSGNQDLRGDLGSGDTTVVDNNMDGGNSSISTTSSTKMPGIENMAGNGQLAGEGNVKPYHHQQQMFQSTGERSGHKRRVLVFPKMTSYDRLLVHTMAKRFNLKTTSEPMWDHEGIKSVHCRMTASVVVPLLRCHDFIPSGVDHDDAVESPWQHNGQPQTAKGIEHERQEASESGIKKTSHRRSSGGTVAVGGTWARALAGIKPQGANSAHQTGSPGSKLKGEGCASVVGVSQVYHEETKADDEVARQTDANYDGSICQSMFSPEGRRRRGRGEFLYSSTTHSANAVVPMDKVQSSGKRKKRRESGEELVCSLDELHGGGDFLSDHGRNERRGGLANDCRPEGRKRRGRGEFLFEETRASEVFENASAFARIRGRHSDRLGDEEDGDGEKWSLIVDGEDNGRGSREEGKLVAVRRKGRGAFTYAYDNSASDSLRGGARESGRSVPKGKDSGGPMQSQGGAFSDDILPLEKGEVERSAGVRYWESREKRKGGAIERRKTQGGVNIEPGYESTGPVDENCHMKRRGRGEFRYSNSLFNKDIEARLNSKTADDNSCQVHQSGVLLSYERSKKEQGYGGAGGVTTEQIEERASGGMQALAMGKVERENDKEDGSRLRLAERNEEVPEDGELIEAESKEEDVLRDGSAKTGAVTASQPAGANDGKKRRVSSEWVEEDEEEAGLIHNYDDHDAMLSRMVDPLEEKCEVEATTGHILEVVGGSNLSPTRVCKALCNCARVYAVGPTQALAVMESVRCAEELLHQQKEKLKPCGDAINKERTTGGAMQGGEEPGVLKSSLTSSRNDATSDSTSLSEEGIIALHPFEEASGEIWSACGWPRRAPRRMRVATQVLRGVLGT